MVIQAIILVLVSTPIAHDAMLGIRAVDRVSFRISAHQASDIKPFFAVYCIGFTC